MNTERLRDLIGEQGTSKPSSWAEVETAVEPIDVSTLPHFPEVEVYGLSNDFAVGEDFCAAFAVRAPQFFVVLRTNSAAEFLINTEGYGYAREALRLRS